MSELKLARRIVRAVVVFLLFAVLVTIAPALSIPLPVTRVLSVILLALVVITPFLPARERW
jgi:hypothetical protein